MWKSPTRRPHCWGNQSRGMCKSQLCSEKLCGSHATTFLVDSLCSATGFQTKTFLDSFSLFLSPCLFPLLSSYLCGLSWIRIGCCWMWARLHCGWFLSANSLPTAAYSALGWWCAHWMILVLSLLSFLSSLSHFSYMFDTFSLFSFLLSLALSHQLIAHHYALIPPLLVIGQIA